MIRINEIQEAMLHLVGWEQSYDPQQQIDESLTLTESGLVFQQAHPMVTLENVRAVMPEDYMYQYPEWKADVNYSLGQVVKHKGKLYESTAAGQNIGNDPEVATAVWKPYSFLTQWLTRLTRQAIAKTVQTFIQKKSLFKFPN